MVGTYLLDTNAWSHYLKFGGVIGSKIREIGPGSIVTCSVVLAKLLHGAKKYGHPLRRESLVLETLAPYRSLPFDDDAADQYAKVRHMLESQGDIIGGNDLLIAAIALTHG